MKSSKKQILEALRIENQLKLELETQWFLNLKKGMPVFIQDNEAGQQMVVFCENDVANNELVIGSPFNVFCNIPIKRFKYEDAMLVNDVGRIWLNGSHGVYVFEATKQLIETTPIFMPKNTSPDLMQAITLHLNKIFKGE